MKIHVREKLCDQASMDLRRFIVDVLANYDLTDAESLRVVNEVLSSWIGSFAKLSIREERHGDLDKPGGIE